MLVDTHCHIHEPSYPLDANEVLYRAHQMGVEKLICVGTSEQSSKEAIEFAIRHKGVFASVGVHPHDTKDGWEGIRALLRSHCIASPLTPSPLSSTSSQAATRHDNYDDPSLYSAELASAQTSSNRQEGSSHLSGRGDNVTHSAERGVGSASRATLAVSSRSPTTLSKHLQPEAELTSGLNFSPGAKPFGGDGGGRGEKNEVKKGEQNKLIAVGEIGLDYFYTHSPREVQIKALNEQIELALKYDLPVIFHVREAFDDFWPIFDNFHGVRGELHSFTDSQKHMEEGLKRGLYIGVNGISTFTKNEAQKATFTSIPLERLLLETDAPFLTPAPLRGKVNEPAFVRQIAEYHMRIRGITLKHIATATTTNADALFALH